jgi:hypothetical protein
MQRLSVIARQSVAASRLCGPRDRSYSEGERPGLWILIPAIAAAGGSGMFLSRSRKGRLVESKKKRMPFIAANGLLVLVPCAIVLNRWASAGSFDAIFYAVQAIELAAGAVNLTLMGLNVRDGLKMTGRLRHSSPSVTKTH